MRPDVEGLVMVVDSGQLVILCASTTEVMLAGKVPGCCDVWFKFVLTRWSFKFLSLRKASRGGALKMFLVSVSLI